MNWNRLFGGTIVPAVEAEFEAKPLKGYGAIWTGVRNEELW
jgi:hypothetical protein